WQSGERRDYRFVGTRLAEAGIVVVIPDYRLYPQVRFPVFVEDAAAAGEALDRTLPYVLTLRMRPTKVQLRLLAAASDELRYVLIKRLA
ncbi:alpha/beta hydrolase fold domain-containing protein, partial [Shewanella algae]|uniref:alpha/beta hydrolase n=1 Tax=Shewanella algae TaxID=38313 RepID=UPI00318E75AF